MMSNPTSFFGIRNAGTSARRALLDRTALTSREVEDLSDADVERLLELQVRRQKQAAQSIASLADAYASFEDASEKYHSLIVTRSARKKLANNKRNLATDLTSPLMVPLPPSPPSSPSADVTTGSASNVFSPTEAKMPAKEPVTTTTNVSRRSM